MTDNQKEFVRWVSKLHDCYENIPEDHWDKLATYYFTGCDIAERTPSLADDLYSALVDLLKKDVAAYSQKAVR